MENLTFSQALEQAKQGFTISRKAWPETIIVRVQYPDAGSANTEPYLYMVKKSTTDGGKDKRFPLDLSAESIFAEDWFTVKEATADKEA